MNPTRLLLVAPSLDIMGGQSVQASRLFVHLQTEPSVQVTFLPVNPRLPGPLAALQQVKYVRTIVTFIAYLLALLRAVPKQEVLHVFAAGYTSFLLAAAPAILIGRMLGKKTILNYRDGRAEDHLAKWPSTVSILRRADLLVTSSGFLVDVFARHGIAALPDYNLMDADRFRYRERARPAPVFLHNRGLEPVYDVPCTLRAFALIQRRYPQASLVVAHDGPLRAELESLSQNLQLRNVRFIGGVPPEQMPSILDESDIYLTTPCIDNMPGSLLECFAAGLPVVATRVGGIPCILEDGRTGLLASPGDAESIAACAFRYLEEDGLALSIARAARAECGKYSWASVGPQWLSLYRSMKNAVGS